MPDKPPTLRKQQICCPDVKMASEAGRYLATAIATAASAKTAFASCEVFRPGLPTPLDRGGPVRSANGSRDNERGNERKTGTRAGPAGDEGEGGNRGVVNV